MNKLIILIVIVLGVIAVAQLLRLSELTTKHFKRDPGEIPQDENMFNANLFVVFGVILFASLIYFMLDYGYVHLGPSGSMHGQDIDFLFDLQYLKVLLILFIFCGILFYFARKYVRKPGVKAYYYPHNNKLEMLWTVVPAVVVTAVIILGLKTWHETTKPADPEAVNVEIFSYQFAWTARYSGPNNTLGEFDYKLTTDENKYGIKTKVNIKKSLELMKVGKVGQLGIKMLEERLNDPTVVMSEEDRDKLVASLHRKERMARLLDAMYVTYADSTDELANDDVIVEDSLILLKGQKYNFHFRSKDVIHSAYMPHFRLQMNTVPGMITYFKMQPIYSTKEMKEIMNDPDWEYALLCNKVCGGSHYKMKMSIKVLEPEEFLAWQKSKATYDGKKWIRGNEEDILNYYRAIAQNAESNR